MRKIRHILIVTCIMALLLAGCNKKSAVEGIMYPSVQNTDKTTDADKGNNSQKPTSGKNEQPTSGNQGEEATSGNQGGNQGEEATSGNQGGNQGEEATSASQGGNQGEEATSGSQGGNQGEEATSGSQGGNQGGSNGIKPLKVSGTKITDYDGNVVQLRGVSTHGLSWFPGYVNKEAFTQFKNEWGCNIMRLAMYTAEYNGYCTGDANNKQNLKNLIDNGVNYATELGMYVIIDWHILNDSNPHTYKEESKKFFGEMSAKYKNHTNVIYEICNEPNGGTSWWDVKSYAQEVIPVIRANDPDAIIIVGTPTWSQDVDQVVNNRINDPNVVYALHFYAATHTDWIRNKLQTALNNGIPVIISEFSICDASGNGAINYNEAQKWIDMIKQNKIGYVMWNLSNKGETSAFFNSWCQKTSGFTMDDLSATAKWFLSIK